MRPISINTVIHFLTSPCSPVGPEEMVGSSTGLASPSLLTGSSTSFSPESLVAPAGPYKVRKPTIITLNLRDPLYRENAKFTQSPFTIP